VRVEPFVTVGQLTRFLSARGYMLAVHLEIADATIGGLALAAGMTTHSHKAGMLFESVVAWDVVLADGTLVRATESEHDDLFRALPWSHGTLGLLVALELKIERAKKFVRLTYEPIASRSALCKRVRELSSAPDAPDFVEATVFARDRAVVISGRLDDRAVGGKVARIGRPWAEWFYKHVEKRGAGEELVPLAEYLLRHNRSIFWVAADMIPFGNDAWFRFLAGFLMPPRVAFLKLSTTPAVRRFTFTRQVFQDIVLPQSAMERALDRADALFGIYPILIYPSRVSDRGGQLRPRENLYFDLGIYGVPAPIKRGENFPTVHAMREMEAFTREVGGWPFLYADTFMTREEFARMFDLSLYRRVRLKYGAEGAFPDLYEKIVPEVDVFAVLAEEAVSSAAWANESSFRSPTATSM
jgi:delta24-sterol reductase